MADLKSASTDTRETEADALRFLRFLIHYRIVIAALAAVGALIGVAVAYLMTPVYSADTLLARVTKEERAGSLPFSVDDATQLFSFAGMDLSASSDKHEALAVLQARGFTMDFIREENLLPVLFSDLWDEETKTWTVADDDVPTMSEAYEMFDEDIRTVTEHRRTGLVTLTIAWTDPDLAAHWAKLLVERINQQMRNRDIVQATSSLDYLREELNTTSILELEQVIYRLMESQVNNIMFANVTEEYVLRVLDAPQVPDEDEFVSPNRPLVIVSGALLGLLSALLFAVTHNFYQTRIRGMI